MRKFITLLFSTCLFLQNPLHATGLAGGSNVYVSIVLTPSGVTVPISGFVPTGAGQIRALAINDSDFGIIGGEHNGGDAYAVVLSPAGVATQITGPGAPIGAGDIFRAAINASGLGVIGGRDNADTDAYAAIIPSSGVAIPLSGTPPVGGGFIADVDINSSGTSIVVGNDGGVNNAYAAIVTPAGVATAIGGAGAPVSPALVQGAGINDSGNGIIVGRDNGVTDAYAAIVVGGVATEVVGAGAPTGSGTITGAAINNSGNAIISGFDGGVVNAYAAIVSPGGVATALSGDAPTGVGNILAADINESGVAIIGGAQGGNQGYAAFVDPSGVATAITVDAGGLVRDVAINEAGVAIIGGQTSANEPFVSPVAPSGTITDISGPAVPSGTGTIFGVAINGLLDVTSMIVPPTVGPGSSFSNSLFALSSQALPTHLSSLLSIRKTLELDCHGRDRDHPGCFREISLLADASEVVQLEEGTTCVPYQCYESQEKPNYSIWAAPLGDYAHQKKEGDFPTIDNWISGILAAFDYYGIHNTVIGGGAAYAFNYAHLGNSTGHAKTHQEFLTLYASWTRKHFFISLALWGGIYQAKNVRHTPFSTSKAKFDGWILNPNLQISTPFYAVDYWFMIDPFAMFDYANNWQGKINESGPSGFNLNIGSEYTSLLRSEVGVRFFETIKYDWGLFILTQKGSYINKHPFHTGAVQAAFVGSISSFSVALFSNQTQNLGAVQFNMEFIPRNVRYPYGSINYQGEFGSSFQNHLISLEIGKDF